MNAIRWTLYIILLTLATASIFYFKENSQELNIHANSVKYNANPNCNTRLESFIVRGDSMAGILESGQKVIVSIRHYECAEIQKGDIILYNYSGNEVPLIKIVFGLPGDHFYLTQNNDSWSIVINDKAVTNSKNETYVIDKHGYSLFALYWQDYKGMIPKDAFLLLGNRASGSLDSSRFGLVHKSTIIGKVLR